MTFSGKWLDNKWNKTARRCLVEARAAMQRLKLKDDRRGPLEPVGARIRLTGPTLMINTDAVRDQLCAATTLQIRNYFRPLVANFIINYTLKFHSAVSGALCLDNRSLWSHGELLRGSVRAIKVFVRLPTNFNACFEYISVQVNCIQLNNCIQ